MNAEGYQINYFNQEPVKKILKRYSKIMKIVPVREYFSDCNAVLDVGCGPYGGLFTTIQFPTMVGLDCLWPIYEKRIVCPVKNLVKAAFSIEEFESSVLFDGIFCMDALNYCNIKKAAISIINVLDNNGVFLLYVNLRTKQQIHNSNEVPLSEEDVNKEFCCLELLHKELWEKDHISNKPYKTMGAIWKKS